MRPRAPRATLVLAVALALVGVSALAACGGGATEATTTEGAPATSQTEPATAPETGGETAAEGDAANGATVWQDAGCASCHTLAAAGATGAVGPNLDDVKPSFDTVVERVTNGGGGMPAFGDEFSEQQIRDVAAYVVESTGG